MGYRYRTQCVDTIDLLHEVIAADCPTISSDGVYLIQCTPSSINISVTTTEIISGTQATRAWIPDQLLCNSPSVADTVELAWLVGGVWVAAWTIKMVAEVIRRT